MLSCIQVFNTPVQLSLIASQPQLLPDPWLTPLAQAVAPAQITQAQPKPLLLLAEASSGEKVQSPKSEVTTKDLLWSIDVDTLKLREARKIAKALGIAQKVNGKDQTLAFLRSQIKLKLQQSLHPEVACDLREKLIAC